MELETDQRQTMSSPSDLPELFRKAVDDGWVSDQRGAWLMRHFRATYFGSPEAFRDVTGYEAAVNGRGIPDLDLASRGTARAAALARRGATFARAALHRLNADYPDHPPASAYVSISEVDMDDEVVYVGDVTFVTTHHGEPPYLEDVEGLTANAVLVIDSAECVDPS
ncbi:hypothetical protein [Mangrovihabitans endophyticus]|uniref:Uncharacterized protein n=1 Tax=Mangrovihabitans endophyticus TaxID=1751298 RepID=A0A8J3BZI8_9ACTN|nr:hypothetical protein [Mangrovihabitans endophyticus]GGK88736.1 hypothetical protein GCM10012284_23470 [Mangrovihabitans endophyticus]